MFGIKRALKPLYIQVIVGAALGIFLGVYAPDIAVQAKPLGDGFVKLLKMLAAPIIFTTVVVGIAKTEDIKSVGRIGLKALLWFEAATTCALLIGLVVGKVIQPGAGMNVDPRTLDAGAATGFVSTAQSHGLVEFLQHIIPDTLVGSFAEGDILQVVFLSVLFGIGLARLGQRGRPLLGVIEGTLDTLFAIIAMVMRLAPLGAFGAMGFTIGRYGFGSLLQLGQLLIAFYTTCLLFVFLVLAIVIRVCGLPFLRFLGYLRDELVVTLGAASAEPALPSLMQKLERLGCPKAVVGLVVPTGYAFNLDGVCIYLTMSVVFIAQATNTDLTFGQEFVILLVGMFTTKGMSGVPGGGFVALAATLSSVGHLPVAGIALLLGIDRFMGEARAVTSIIGNAVATVVVARWEGTLDVVQARGVLRGTGAWSRRRRRRKPRSEQATASRQAPCVR